MKMNPKDLPKAIALVVGIVGVLLLAVVRIMPFLSDDKPAAKRPAPANAVALTAPPAGIGDPNQLVSDVSRWSQVPLAPVGGDPFRQVLPSDFRTASSPVGRPPRLGGDGFGGNVPVIPGAVEGGMGATIDFPEVRLQGVIVDSGNPARSFAVVVVGGRVLYAHPGDELSEGLTLDSVTQLGAWIKAGKERAFIEVNGAYKPTGVAAQS